MKSISVLFCFLIQLVCFAQFKNLKFTNVNTIDGLSSSTCIEIFQDVDGYLWFGTIDGLNRYNGFNFDVFKPILNDPESISNIRINSIIDDSNGNLWIGTNNGLNYFNLETNKFKRIALSNHIFSDSNKSEVINKLLFDKIDNVIWVATNNGVVQVLLGRNKFDLNNIKFRVHRYNTNNINSIDNSQVQDVLKDKNDEIWVVTDGSNLNKYDRETHDFDRIFIETQKSYELNHISKKVFIDDDGDFWIGNNLSNLIRWNRNNNSFENLSITKGLIPINDFYQGDEGVIWISTDGFGLFFYDKKSGTLIEQVVKNPSDHYSIPNNQPTKIFEDKDGIFWLGSYDKGVFKLDKTKNLFGHYYYQMNSNKGLNGEIVQSVLEDSKHRIWLSVYNKGLNLFDNDTKTFRYFENNKSKYSLSSNKILNSFEGSNGNIWLCTFDGGLNKFNPESFTAERYLYVEEDNYSIGENSVRTGVEDSKNRIWLGLKSEGLNIFDRNTGKFYRYNIELENAINLESDYVFSLFIDSKNRLLVGTNSGLNVISLDSLKSYIPKKLDLLRVDISSIIGRRVNCISEDCFGNIWVGTEVGIHKLDEQLNLLKSYSTREGLLNNLVVGIQEDDDKNIWISSKSGLSMLDTEKDEIKNYDVQDGIQGAEFQSKSITKTEDGRIIVGGINGFNMFYPKDVLYKKPIKVSPRITSFKLNNSNVKPGDSVNGRVLFDKNISFTKKMILHYNENYLTFGFESLFYRNPNRVKFQYRLIGIDNDFISSGENRVINYSNIKPGKYTFQVRASMDGTWSDENIAALQIEIMNPFWKTWWAYMVYVLVGLLLFVFFLKLYSKNIQDAQKSHLDQMKLKFFINVSHEFRTPLALILNPLDKILGNYNNPEQIKKSALSAKRSARRLLHLTNQLLDYSKMDAGMAPLKLERGEFVSFSQDIFDLFKGLAFSKKIQFSFESHLKKIEFVFDFDKVEKIITNLLSNAIKFSEEGGSIVMSLNVVKSEEIKKLPFSYFNDKRADKYLELKVKDEGIGMNAIQLKNVFSRFYRLDTTATGTGIGLNLTKALVEILKGDITVHSEIGKGTVFVVRLPFETKLDALPIKKIKNQHIENSINSVEYEIITTASNDNIETVDSKNISPNLATVLIVEDNRELRVHLKDELQNFYNVLEAANGEQGLKMVFKHHPEIIVSDVMMPKKNGYEMCRELKKSFETCHIPIIMLTARTRDEDLVNGYIQGADAYLAKPFKIEVLKVRIQTLLAAKQRLREKFAQLGAILPSKEMTTNSIDESFIEKTTKIILDNIDNSDFNLNSLLQELGIGKSHFYRKIQAISGLNPSGFIRTVRLKFASELLLNSNYSIKEISHRAGFNSSTYFGKSFRALYKMSPKEYINKYK